MHLHVEDHAAPIFQLQCSLGIHASAVKISELLGQLGPLVVHGPHARAELDRFVEMGLRIAETAMLDRRVPRVNSLRICLGQKSQQGTRNTGLDVAVKLHAVKAQVSNKPSLDGVPMEGPISKGRV